MGGLASQLSLLQREDSLSNLIATAQNRDIPPDHRNRALEFLRSLGVALTEPNRLSPSAQSERIDFDSVSQHPGTPPMLQRANFINMSESGPWFLTLRMPPMRGIGIWAARAAM